MMEKVFKGKACGKFILLGDHFVAHGSPAIAFPIRSLFCQIQIAHGSPTVTQSHAPVSMQAEIKGVKATPGISTKMRKTLVSTLNALTMPEDPDHWRISSQTNFSTSRGFGSSAAFSCALLRAMLAYQNDQDRSIPSEEQIPDVLQSMEKVFHSNPSGVDASAVWNEKPVYFQKDKPACFLSNPLVDFILVDSGERKGTAELVKRISGFREKNLEQWNKYAADVGDMATQVESCLKSKSSAAIQVLAKAVTEAHHILKELSLSNTAIEEMISVATSLGALAGKVSGAGTGGATVFLAPRGEGKRVAQKMVEKKIPVMVLVEADA